MRDAAVKAARDLQDEKEWQATKKCRDYAVSQARHPSMVQFERSAPPHLNTDGGAIVGLHFRAKNTFGLELTYSMVCVISATGEVSGLATESR